MMKSVADTLMNFLWFAIIIAIVGLILTSIATVILHFTMAEVQTGETFRVVNGQDRYICRVDNELKLDCVNYD